MEFEMSLVSPSLGPNSLVIAKYQISATNQNKEKKILNIV